MEEEIKEALDNLKAVVTPESASRMTVRFIAKHSVAFVASQIAKEYCPTENKKQELQVRAGAYVIGGMAGDAASRWAAREFQEAWDFVNGVVKRVHKKNVEETSEETEPTLVPAE